MVEVFFTTTLHLPFVSFFKEDTIVSCSFAISLGDIHNMPMRSKFVFFQGFLNFLSKVPKFHSVWGGYVYTF